MGEEQYIIQLSLLEQQAQKLQEQFQIIEHQTLELQTLQIGLQELEKSEEKNMLANLGKGIFIKCQIQDKDLVVDVGNRIFVKKTISETLKIIEEQLGKLIETKNRIIGKMQQLQRQMEKIIVEAQKSRKK